MTTFLQFAIDVLSLGSAYALMALGLVIVYGILRLVNFAYGELIMVVGYTLFLLKGSPVPWLVMAGFAVFIAVLTAIATDYVAFRPVREKSVTAVLITSFAFSTLLQNAALLFISPRPRNVPLPDIFSETLQFAGVIVPVRNLLTIALALVLLAVFALLMRRSVLGIAMRAAASHFTMARMLGVPANLIISTAFAVSGLLAGAESALVTLWDAPQESTVGFLQRFYRRIGAGGDRAQALRETMLELRDTFPQPYFWAPFVLVGNPGGLPDLA